MDLKLFAAVAGTVFLAELGDKTQLATLLWSARSEGARLTVFAAAALALIAATGIGVLAGGVIGRYVEPRTLTLGAGAAFVLLGAWTIVEAW